MSEWLAADAVATVQNRRRSVSLFSLNRGGGNRRPEVGCWVRHPSAETMGLSLIKAAGRV